MGKIIHLSAKTARELEEATRREILQILVLHADMRNKAGSTPQYIPYGIREEARRMMQQPNYLYSS